MDLLRLHVTYTLTPAQLIYTLDAAMVNGCGYLIRDQAAPTRAELRRVLREYLQTGAVLDEWREGDVSAGDVRRAVAYAARLGYLPAGETRPEAAA